MPSLLQLLAGLSLLRTLDGFHLPAARRELNGRLFWGTVVGREGEFGLPRLGDRDYFGSNEVGFSLSTPPASETSNTPTPPSENNPPPSPLPFSASRTAPP